MPHLSPQWHPPSQCTLWKPGFTGGHSMAHWWRQWNVKPKAHAVSTQLVPWPEVTAKFLCCCVSRSRPGLRLAHGTVQVSYEGLRDGCRGYPLNEVHRWLPGRGVWAAGMGRELLPTWWWGLVWGSTVSKPISTPPQKKKEKEKSFFPFFWENKLQALLFKKKRKRNEKH